MMEYKSKLKEGSIYLISGSTAGVILMCVFYPLDVVTTRLQLQSKSQSNQKNNQTYYTGMVDCMVKMYRNEGIASFWKGILPPLMIHTPRRAFKFFMFEESKTYFSRGKPHPNPTVYALSAATTGVAEGIMITPFEVVKINQQANRLTKKAATSSWNMTKQVISKGGFGPTGLFKGITATMMRSSFFNLFFFGSYYSAQDYFFLNSDRKAKFSEKVLLGLVAGISATIFTIPLDVAKSRIQGPQPEPDKIKYKWAIVTMFTIYKEEGWRALCNGLGVKILKIGPGGAIMLLVNDYVNKYLATIIK